MTIAIIIGLIFCFLTATLKGITHVILDIRNGHKIDFARSKGYIYLFPYDKNVAEEDEKLKRLCNLFQKLVMFSLIILIIIFFVRFFLNQ